MKFYRYIPHIFASLTVEIIFIRVKMSKKPSEEETFEYFVGYRAKFRYRSAVTEAIRDDCLKEWKELDEHEKSYYQRRLMLQEMERQEESLSRMSILRYVSRTKSQLHAQHKIGFSVQTNLDRYFKVKEPSIAALNKKAHERQTAHNDRQFKQLPITLYFKSMRRRNNVASNPIQNSRFPVVEIKE